MTLYDNGSYYLLLEILPYFQRPEEYCLLANCDFCHTRLHLGFSVKLRIVQVSACKMGGYLGVSERQVRTRQANAGKVRTGQVMTGKFWTGQIWTVQVWKGQVGIC